MKSLRAAVIGAGAFGSNHARVISDSSGVCLSGIFDIDRERATALSLQHGTSAFQNLGALLENSDCAVVATPTVTHEEIATQLLEAGLDVLVEKPIAHSAEASARLTETARRCGRILQVGHLERFNPAITALRGALTIPLFFEIHRLSVFTPRSLDVDVVLDLMIHDLDLVLTITGELPNELRAAGISVLSPLADIANVRLAFPSGCIANLTASRISTEKVRKLRLFQPGEYISVDYERQEAVRLAVLRNEAKPHASLPTIGGASLPVTHGEPLRLELDAFFSAVRTRSEPEVTGQQATAALQIAEAIIAKIKEHGQLVTETLKCGAAHDHQVR